MNNSLFASVLNLKNILFIGLMLLLATACKKENVATNTTTSSAEFYFIGQLDSKPLKFEITTTSEAQMGIFNTSSINAPNCSFTYGAGIGTKMGEPEEKSLQVSFLALFEGKCGDQNTLFPQLFPKKGYDYGEKKDNVEIEYFDGIEKWVSVGSKQRAARFEITESESVKGFAGYFQIVTGKLSCSLFNVSGVEKKLENASFKLIFEPS
jgi:hypothetical protein